MLFTAPIALLLALAPAVFGAPTPTTKGTILDIVDKRALSSSQISQLTNGVCDLSAVAMPAAPSALPPVTPGLSLVHVAVGRGTQNYTCKSSSPTETPAAVGALATLYNSTCASVRAPSLLSDVTKIALDQPIPTAQVADELLSGHHFFLNSTTAFFELAPNNVALGHAALVKTSSSAAPATAANGTNGLGSVPWLKLTAFPGYDFKEVYRLDTAGGVAPKTCDGISGTFEVPYSAVYYFWK